ncbi:thiamine-phosphate pyrophosphorylase [Massilia sp. UYP32]|jgi:thiamine-phosphate pyrophosphorylase|uniref:thiamine phosphate synthase n=1 Tax=Massilia TaxID=149698 RepID=UPI000D928633|nr:MULTISPECIES: thiamine phosphate synthase [Massilia]QYG01139.1 thiamine phosphate synthase [Massilia sp. NP310]HAK91628.1 thiamine phosphate synthase [Massilia timonae]
MRGLYLVTPNWDDTEKLIAATDAALGAGAALVQYRHKEAGPDLRKEQAAALLALCRRHGRPLVINDHLDLCQAIDADGVHLGHTDDGVQEARALLGKDKIVGASCYGELALARAAVEAGASYVAFGGFYPSPVKKYTFVTPPELLDQARAEFSLPIVVIGGMTPSNAAPLVTRGIDLVAAITSVYGSRDPGAAARAFGALFPPA